MQAQEKNGPVYVLFPMSRVFSTPCVPNFANALGRSAQAHVQFVAIKSKDAPAGEFGAGVDQVAWYPFETRGWKESPLVWFFGYTAYALYLILRRRPSALMAISIRGLFVGYLLSLVTGVPLGYYSLEFYPGRKPFWRGAVRMIERICLSRVRLLVLHDEIRLRLYEDMMHRRFPHVAYFPNAPVPSDPTADDERRVRERLGLDPSKKYIQYSGTLNSQRFPAAAFISLLDRLGEDWGLILQSYVGRQGVQQDGHFARLVAKRQLVISEIPLSVREYSALTRLARIGLALYSTTDDNMKYVGLSSGKVGNYWQAGVPVIINRIPFYDTVCPGYRSGEVFDSPDDVPGLVMRIDADYAAYQAGARACYAKFFDEAQHLSRLGDEMRRLISR